MEAAVYMGRILSVRVTLSEGDGGSSLLVSSDLFIILSIIIIDFNQLMCQLLLCSVKLTQSSVSTIYFPSWAVFLVRQPSSRM